MPEAWIVIVQPYYGFAGIVLMAYAGQQIYYRATHGGTLEVIEGSVGVIEITEDAPVVG